MNQVKLQHPCLQKSTIAEAAQALHLHISTVEILLHKLVGVVVACSAGVQHGACPGLLLQVSQQQLPLPTCFLPLTCQHTINDILENTVISLYGVYKNPDLSVGEVRIVIDFVIDLSVKKRFRSACAVPDPCDPASNPV